MKVKDDQNGNVTGRESIKYLVNVHVCVSGVVVVMISALLFNESRWTNLFKTEIKSTFILITTEFKVEVP